MRNGQCPGRLCVAAVIAGVFAATAVQAGSVAFIGDEFSSTGGLGSFDGLLEYDADLFSSVGTLQIMLTNTSAPENGGYITGFLFNVADGGVGTAATLLSDPESIYPFEQCVGNGLNGQPYGNPYDVGAALGGSFLGGGDPTGGIAVGDTGSFTFRIESADAWSLTASSFLDGGPYEFDFLVRFRGFEDGESDKVPAVMIPLPAPIALGAVGLVAAMVGAVRYRRSSKTQS